MRDDEESYAKWLDDQFEQDYDDWIASLEDDWLEQQERQGHAW